MAGGSKEWPRYLDGHWCVPVGDLKDDSIAFNLLIKHGEISTSMLIRAKKMTYSQALRVLDRMEDKGLIRPPDGPDGPYARKAVTRG